MSGDRRQDNIELKSAGNFSRCIPTGYLSAEVSKFSKETGRDLFNEQDILRQFYLHLFQYNHNAVDADLVQDVIRRVARKLFLLRADAPFQLNERTHVANFRSTKFKLVDESVARLLHEKYHYLGSNRKDGFHLGLYTNGSNGQNLMSLATLSPFDLSHLADGLPEGVEPGQVLVLSRLFVFDWCPRNTASFTLGRLFSWIKEYAPEIKMLITYLNTNVGFVGSIYEASNWTLFGLEKKERYLYFDGDYVTDRYMIDLYGTAKFEKLHEKLGERILRSVIPIEPLKIYAYFLDKHLRKKYLTLPVYEFSPNYRLV